MMEKTIKKRVIEYLKALIPEIEEDVSELISMEISRPAIPDYWDQNEIHYIPGNTIYTTLSFKKKHNQEK